MQANQSQAAAGSKDNSCTVSVKTKGVFSIFCGYCTEHPNICSQNRQKGYVFLTDYKSALQELVQTDKKTLEYFLINESGPSHDKLFTIEVRIDGVVYGKGVGKTKKEAEQSAAKDAFRKRAK